MTDRKKPGVAFWATVALVAVLLYVASFGPACWLRDQGRIPKLATALFYRPLIRAMFDGPRPVRRMLRKYAEWGAPPYVLMISFDPIGYDEHGGPIFRELPEDYEPPVHGVLERLNEKH